MTNLRTVALVLLCLAGPLNLSATAEGTTGAAFKRYVKSLWPAASRAGVSRSTFDDATEGLSPDPEVLERANWQPEFKLKPGEYVERLVSGERITLGQAMLREHEQDFAAIEKRYGVSRYILAAIWGVESNFGTKPGKQNVVRSLATLGYEGRRRSFGRKQLIAALRIIERGDIVPAGMTGSWAGAMGHTQFIPTTYNAYAVDFTGDGKRDIWNSTSDALASTANYLKKSGWKSSETWGYEVELPSGFNRKLIGRATKSAARWQKLGVRRVRGLPFARPSDRGYLYSPEGSKGPSFLIIRNFKALKRYNNADLYALAVGHLADRLAGGDAFERSWPSTAITRTSSVLPPRR